MGLTFEEGVEDEIVRISTSGSLAARREVAKVVAFLMELEVRLGASSDFWNVVGTASGRLAAGSSRTNGEIVWRLYPTHAHCIALLSREGADICVLAVCKKAQLPALELQLCQP